MVTPSRKDTVGLKQQLADALGESGKDYWTKLGEFLQGKATKQELDQTAKLVILTPHQEHLHNQLLLSILHNVQHSVPRPSGPTDGGYVVRNHSLSKRVRRKTEEINPLQLKKRFLQQTMCSMPKEDRSRILSLEQQPAQPVQNIFQKNLFPFGFPKGVDSIPRTCVEEGDLPTKETLKQRIRFISAVQGLAGQPSNEVVDLISLALEVSYLRVELHEKADICDCFECWIGCDSGRWITHSEALATT
ncbi:transcriptional coactivator Hfi1/Transcriptional adapter 1 [Gorgonomyces haynaldii]|nr:transcriptional coactivator Hfi1/Transcriptional adapter 1 [Gorgonomyces haynaldii]